MIRTMVPRMTDAASPFLNLPLRTEREAQAARERQRRLDHHGAAFCRRILDGAYERVDQPDGGYRLREVVTGRWIDDKTLAGETSADGASASEATSLATASQTDVARTGPASPIAVPATALAACRLGYQAALRDIAYWISTAVVEPRMHAETLAALNAQIAALANRPMKMIGRSVELG